MDRNTIWTRVGIVDASISLGVFILTTFAGFTEDIPWTYRIPAALVGACAVLLLWRHLTLRRLLMPNRLQSVYENDLMDVRELFSGRSMVRNVTFKNVELTGPGAIYFDPDCKLVKNLTCNPSLEEMMVIPGNQVRLSPFHRFINCTFEDCVLTNVGIIVNDANKELFGIGFGPRPLGERPNEQPAETT